ncbi:MAG: thioredoxin family protein [Acidimicrobiia bacterium]|nr:thioredoxin family protein [Acidimicrobiia bacterium]
MVRTDSTMVPLGTPAPDFRLPDPSGNEFALADFADAPALLVMFLCNHCPFVQHVRRELALLTDRWAARGVAVVGINSNDVDAHPDDSPEHMADEARAVGYRFPYLFDATQDVAKAYRAACTPDFFLYDAEGTLAYRGQMDSSRPGNDVPVTGEDLDAAIDAVLAGESVPEPHHPSMGCNIKWKPGNEPPWFG